MPFVRDAVFSVFSQRIHNGELIVADGGSTDGTLESISDLRRHAPEWNVHILRGPDRSQTHALNRGFGAASGDVLCWLNADEQYLPGTLLAVEHAFHSRPDLDVAFGDRLVLHSGSGVLQTQRTPAMAPRLFSLYGNGLLLSDATFWSRKLHNQVGCLDQDRFPHLCMDYDWFLRLSCHARTWIHLRRPVSVFLEHDGRKSKNHGSLIDELNRTARSQVLRAESISQARLIVGWACSAVWRNLALRGVRGLLRTPRLCTIYRILGR